MAFQLQEWIHRVEEGSGSRILVRLAGFLGMVALAVFYNMAAFHNLASPEGMDYAQAGRNIARGEGFVTDHIRPLSLHLIYRRATNVLESSASSQTTNGAASSTEQLWIERMQARHPNLAHAPMYPLLLAGLFQWTPLAWQDVSQDASFNVYEPDLALAIFNQGLLVVAACLVWNLGRRMFDETVGWVSAIVFLGSDLYWQFSLSGLPTLWLIVLFLTVLRLLFALETESESETCRLGRCYLISVVLGAVMGMVALTQYSAAVLAIPLLVMLATLSHPRRGSLMVVVSLVFLVMWAPWLVRNYQISGTLFGTAGFSVFENTASFPGDLVQRSIRPYFGEFTLDELRAKWVVNFREMLQSDLLRVGGSWGSAFFLVGLLIPFRKPVLSRLRFFVLLCLAVLIACQALVGKGGDAEVGDVHPGNLLALVGPVIFIYGVGMFFTILMQGNMQAPAYRFPAIGIFCLLMAAGVLIRLLPPHSVAIQYPPYFPPWIQQKARHMGVEDWTMTDIPWAMAWYGDRPGVTLTPYYIDPYGKRYVNDFFAIHDVIKPLSGLYLSTKTLNQVSTEPLWDWVSRAGDEGGWEPYVKDWESFALIGIYLNSEVPEGFPLRNAPKGIFPELFLTDSEHILEKAIQSP